MSASPHLRHSTLLLQLIDEYINYVRSLYLYQPSLLAIVEINLKNLPNKYVECLYT